MHKHRLHFCLIFNKGIYLISNHIDIVAPVAAFVATSSCLWTFANIVFCEHFCLTGEAGISGGGRSGRVHPSLP